MVDAITRTEVGELELFLDFDGNLDLASLAAFITELDLAAGRSRALQGGKLEIVSLGSGSLWMRIVARVGVATALTGTMVAGASGNLGSFANVAQIAQFGIEIRDRIFGPGVEDKGLSEASCSLVYKNNADSLEIRATGAPCLNLDRAAAEALRERVSSFNPYDGMITDSSDWLTNPEDDADDDDRDLLGGPGDDLLRPKG